MAAAIADITRLIAKADYERTLWRLAPCRAFPGRRRRTVHRSLDRLRQLRNRIAHREPIFDRDRREDYENLPEAVGWILADVRTWIEAHCLFPDTLRAPPSSPVRFRPGAASQSTP